MTRGDQVEVLAQTVDLDALTRWILAASAAELEQARDWLRENTDDQLAPKLWVDHAGLDRQNRRPWFVALLTIAVEPPVAAARSAALLRVNGHAAPQGVDHLIRVAQTRDDRWVREFVSAAAVHQANPEVHSLVAALVVERDLPFPEGAGFVTGWQVSQRWTDLSTMTERMLADPLAPRLVHAYLRSSLVSSDPPVLTAAVALVDAGRLDRERLVAEAVEVLTTLPPAGAQRAIAAMLSALHLTLDDLPGGMPFAQGLVATCHGSVGAVLLPLAIAALSGRDELVELTTTIAGRPERTQKTVLLRALRATELQERVGVPAVLDALDVLRQTSDDEKLLAQVATLVNRLGGRRVAVEGPEPVARGLWELSAPGAPNEAQVVTGFPLVSRQVARGVALELERGRDDSHRLDVPTRADLYLGAVVAHAHLKGVAPVRDWLAADVEAYADRPGTLGEAIVDWVADPGTESFRAAHARAGEPRTGEDGYLRRPYALNVPADAFRYLLAREALLRLGRSPCLLSTPSHDDHTLAFEVLAERVARCNGSSVGALDLFQAVLRLRPVDAAALRTLDGTTLPIDDEAFGGSGDLPDAVDLIRSWVGAGGLPEVTWRVGQGLDHGCARWVADRDLGALQPLLGLAPRGFLNDDPSRYSSHEVARLAPRWPDCLYWPAYALSAPRHHSGPYGLTDHVLTREWPIGPPLYDVLLGDMAAPDRRRREAAARIALDLIGQQRFDGSRFTRVALMRLDAGVLVLARVAGVWDLVAQAGGLRALWPVMNEVVAAACSTAPVTAGTPDLFRLMTALLPEVPEPVVPPAVRRYAERPGSTKAQFEARRFVETADRQVGP